MAKKAKSDYTRMLQDCGKPFCWACGRGNDKPYWWPAPWFLQRAHLASGSGRMFRALDRRAVNILCSVCHESHSHLGGGTVNLCGQHIREISDANMLWLKRERDPEYWDAQWIGLQWIGLPPDPVEPVWLREQYQERHSPREVTR